MKEKKLPKDFIPNFDELYNKTVEFVKEHQGEKGYIDTQNETCDTMYCLDYYNDFAEEGEIKGVKVDDDKLMVAYEPYSVSNNIIYTEEDFKDVLNWEWVRYSDLAYVYTLLSIAESIHEYVQE